MDIGILWVDQRMHPGRMICHNNSPKSPLFFAQYPLHSLLRVTQIQDGAHLNHIMIHELPRQSLGFQIHYYQVKNHVRMPTHSLDLVDRSYPLNNLLTSNLRLVRLRLHILVLRRLFSSNRITRFLFRLMPLQGRIMIHDQIHHIRTLGRVYLNLHLLGVIRYLLEHPRLNHYPLSRDIIRIGRILLDLVIQVVNHHYRLNRLHLDIHLSRTIIGRVTLDPLKWKIDIRVIKLHRGMDNNHHPSQ